MNCACGQALKLPAVWIGNTEYNMPVAQFNCGCGRQTKVQIETMKPYTAERSEGFPPERGNYSIVQGRVEFTCPVCKGMAGISKPVHSIDANGKVTPSYVCPYKCGFHSWMTLKDWK